MLGGEEHGAIAAPPDAALTVAGKVLCFGGTDDTDDTGVAPCESLVFLHRARFRQINHSAGQAAHLWGYAQTSRRNNAYMSGFK